MRVRLSKMRVFSFDCYIFRMKFPTGFTPRNLHGFARFPSDSTALVHQCFDTVSWVTAKVSSLLKSCWNKLKQKMTNGRSSSTNTHKQLQVRYVNIADTKSYKSVMSSSESTSNAKR